MTKYIKILLFSLYLIYESQGIVYGSGTIISQSILFLILAICSIYFLKTFLLRKRKEPFVLAWTALLLLNVVGFIFTGRISNVNQFIMMKEILVCMLTFYPFYYFSIKGQLDRNDLLVFFIIMLVVQILQFFINRNAILSAGMPSAENVVNNIAYRFVALFPFVFLFQRKKLLSIIMTVIILYFVISGAKRGAFLVSMIILICFIFYQIKANNKNNSIGTFAGNTALIVIILIVLNRLYLQNQYLNSRLAAIFQGDSSGRAIIYSNILNNWIKSDAFHKIFGHGFAASIIMSGTGSYAHNDWLELLSNFGIVGIIVYIMVFYHGIRLAFNKNWNIDKRILAGTIIIAGFAISLFSMWYTSLGSYLYSMLLAYLIGPRSASIV